MTGTLWEHDLSLLSQGPIVGIDEVGRGCVAGPIVACAVEITSPAMLECLRGLPVKDSKALSSLWRQKIVVAAAAGGLTPKFAFRDATAVDNDGIQACNDGILTELVNSYPQDRHILVDGIQNGIPSRAKTIIKGESVSVAIALASILAKEHRDALMIQLESWHCGYGFDKHKGYGTEAHLAAIREHGLIPGVHRKNFLRGFLGSIRPAKVA